MKDNTNIHFSHMDWDKQWDPEWLIHVLYLTIMWCHHVTYLTMMSDQASSWSSTEKQTKGNVISSVSDLFWSILTQQSCDFVITLAMLVVSVPPVAGTGPYFVRSSFDHLKVVGWSPALQTLDCYSYIVIYHLRILGYCKQVTKQFYYFPLSILFSF